MRPNRETIFYFLVVEKTAGKMASILFASPNAPHGFLSNFYRSPFCVAGVWYSSSEAYFQSQKFPGNPAFQQRIAGSSPAMAARLGRSRSNPLRPDWNSVRDDVMRTALRHKFQGHPELRRALLATGNRKLKEHRWADAYWGDGGNGKGRNRLGVLLMELRESLRS